jgi:hypothetical protein
MQQDLQEARANIDSIDPGDVCSAAEAMFGPHGQVAPNLMIPVER